MLALRERTKVLEGDGGFVVTVSTMSVAGLAQSPMNVDALTSAILLAFSMMTRAHTWLQNSRIKVTYSTGATVIRSQASATDAKT